MRKWKPKRSRAYNNTNHVPKKLMRFYQSKEWKDLRKEKLKEVDYLCEDCMEEGVVRVANTVHHIEPIRDNWGKRLEYTNLKALCPSCHESYHNRYGGESKKEKVDKLNEQVEKNKAASMSDF